MDYPGAVSLPMAVMGGIALARWQHVRATRDVDLLLSVEPLDLEKVLASLQVAGFQTKRTASITQLNSLRLVQLTYEPPQTFLPIQVDLLIADSEYHRAALKRSIPTLLAAIDLQVVVLACEDLILHKLMAGRLIDLADVAALLRVNHDTLDMQYLQQWLAQLNLEPSFKTIWSEVFPL